MEKQSVSYRAQGRGTFPKFLTVLPALGYMRLNNGSEHIHGEK